MGTDNDLFRIAMSRDIYHTLYLWAELSPRLAGRKGRSSPKEAEKRKEDISQQPANEPSSSSEVKP